jgi:hypothetical protein
MLLFAAVKGSGALIMRHAYFYTAAGPQSIDMANQILKAIDN